MAALAARAGRHRGDDRGACTARGAPFLGICVGMQLLAIARPGVRRDPRPRLDRRRRAAARAGRAAPARSRTWAGTRSTASPTSRCSPACRPGRHVFHPLLRLLPARTRPTSPPGPITAAGSPRPWRAATSPACSSTRRSRQAAGLRAAGQLPGVAPLILYPAIDLKDGQCVRVVHGDMATATVFNDHPAAQAAAWVDGRLRLAARGRPERRGRRARRSTTRR